jgi:hypothetical protein
VANNEVGFTLKINGVDQTLRSLTDLQGAIKDLTKEAASADYGSKEFEAITERIQQAKAAVREFKNDTRTKEVKDQFNDLAGGVAGSFDVAEGALKSFGVESKALGAVSTTVNGLITAALNARQIAELKVDAAQARRMVTEKAAAAGTVILDVVNKALNITLKANPIGVLVTALGLLTVGILNAIGPIKKFLSSFEGLNNAMNATLDVFRNIGSALTGGLIDDASTAKTRENAKKSIEALDDVGSAGNRRLQDEKTKLAWLEASGAKEEQILAQKKKTVEAELQLKREAFLALEAIRKADGKLSDDDLKKQKELAQGMRDLKNQLVTDAKTSEKKIADEATAAQQKKDAKTAERKSKAEAYAKEVQGKYEESLKKTRDLTQKSIIDSIADENEKARKTLEIQQKNAVDELQVEINKVESKRKSGKELTAEEIKYLKSMGKQMVALKESQGIELENLDKEQAKAKKEALDAYNKELTAINEQFKVNSIAKLEDRAKAELDASLKAQTLEIQNRKITEDQKTALILAAAATTQQKKNEIEAQAAKDRRDFEIGLETDQFVQQSMTADAKRDDDIKRAKELYGDTVEFEAAKTEIVKQNAKAQADIERAKLNAQLAETATALGQVADLVGKNTVAGKAFGIAQATINTYQGVTAALSAESTLPSPFDVIAKIANVATVLATGLGAVQSITAVQIPNAGGGGGAAPTVEASKFATGGFVSGPGTSNSDSIPVLLSNGESVINANSTQMYGGLLNQINQAGGGAPIEHPSIKGDAPIFKTYVVASDMTSQQEADRRIRNIARI